MPTSTPSRPPGGNEPQPEIPAVEMLARMANEFFKALPGASPILPMGEFPVAGGVLGSSEVPRTPGSPAGRAAPGGIPTGLPDPVPGPSSSEATPGRSTTYAAPVAPAIPHFEPPPAPSGLPSGSPYYFMGEASAYQPGGLPPGDLPHAESVTAKSFGLPGETELRAMVEAMFPKKQMAPAPAAHGGGPFYFLDTATAPLAAVPAIPSAAHPAFDVQAVRRDFPILAERVNGRPLIWLDNAATTQKPQAVIDRLVHFYRHENSNIHRAAHELAARATDAYESARGKVARFLGASSAEEIVFVRGATEAINLVAKSWGAKNVAAGDEIVLTWLEHHANIVPWQQLAKAVGATIKVAPVDDSGQVLLEEYQALLGPRTRIVAFPQVSNALGTVTPAKTMVELAHRAGAVVLVDGAQAVSHMRVNVQDLDADFYVFSGHKIFAPTGIGVVYGKRALLEAAPPWQGGGNMIADVTFERTIYQAPPARFEAGTGNIADAVGLGAALDYLERLGMENVSRYEHDLLEYGTRALQTVPGLRLIGTAADKASVMSFVLAGYAPEEVGKALNQEGIAVRSGHHCAQPILRRFGVEATVRPSLAFYNTCEEIDVLVAALHRLASARRPS